MSDEIGSGDILASVVQDGSISPADLDISVHNVALECCFALSRISVSHALKSHSDSRTRRRLHDRSMGPIEDRFSCLREFGR